MNFIAGYDGGNEVKRGWNIEYEGVKNCALSSKEKKMCKRYGSDLVTEYIKKQKKIQPRGNAMKCNSSVKGKKYYINREILHHILLVWINTHLVW